VWYLAGVFGTLAAAGYVVMHYAVEEPANAPPEAAARDTVDAAA
jgi:hypothetical protein